MITPRFTLCTTCETPMLDVGCLQCAADAAGKPLVLIDADIVTFQAAATSEATVHFGDSEDDQALVQEPDVALFKCNGLIHDIMEAVGSEHVLLCFSCSPSKDNFRRQVLPTYKHNRVKSWKPKLLASLRSMLEETYPALSVHKLEADDIMGILTKTEGRTAIATIDKDLDQLPGLHFNWKHQDLYTVSNDQANYHRWAQVLSGDAVDGYTGIPRVGPKTAVKILGDLPPSAYKDACEEAYASRGITKDEYEAQVAVAQILRPSQYDWETGLISTTYFNIMPNLTP